MTFKPELLDELRAMDEGAVFAALYRDDLTGLLNRRAFDAAHSPAVAVVDLDSLKYLNDTAGHREGDAQIQRLAHHLTRRFGLHDVYRMSGDEFAVTGESVPALQHALMATRREFPGFSFGVSTCIESADVNLRADKNLREATGLRAARGECPPWAGSGAGLKPLPSPRRADGAGWVAASMIGVACGWAAVPFVLLWRFVL